MINSLKDNIKNNVFIQNACNYCDEYGVHYAIYDYVENDNSAKNGIYFVLGLNESQVKNQDIDIRKIAQRSSRNKTIFFTDVAFIKLNNQSSYYVAKTVLSYCQAVKYIKDNFEKRGYTVPNEIPKTELVNYYMTEYNLKNKAQIESWIYELLLNAKEQSIENIGLGFNIFNKTNETNEVSLDDIIKTSTSLTSRKIKVKYLEDIRNTLHKIPDLNFNISNIEEIKLDSKTGFFANDYEDNDLSFFKLTFDSAFNEIVSREMFKIVYPNLSNKYLVNTEELNDLVHFGIDEDSVCDFVRNCDKNGIDVKISLNNLFFNDNNTVLHMACNKKDAPVVEEILIKMLDLYNQKNKIQEINLSDKTNTKKPLYISNDFNTEIR